MQNNLYIAKSSVSTIKGTVVGRNGPLIGGLDGLITAILPEYFPEKTAEAEKLPEFNAEEAKQVPLSNPEVINQSQSSSSSSQKISAKEIRSIENKYGLINSQAAEQHPFYSDVVEDGYENVDRWLKFGRGFGKGMLLNATLNGLCALPKVGKFIGAGATGTSAGILFGYGASMATKFEQDHFKYTQEYLDIVSNPLLSSEEKEQISRNADARYEQAKQERLNAGGFINKVKNMWRDHPEGLGTGAGMFFSFGKPPGDQQPGFYLNSNPIKPRLPFKVPSSKSKVTSQPQATSSSHNATTFNAHKSINKKFSALENAQKDAVRIQELPDGRIRYYTEETFSTNPGPTRGSSYVTEYNPNNGQIRSWMECYDHSGNVNRVHPKMLDGQDLKAQHYPPTKSELESFSQNSPKPRGPQ